MPHVVMTFRAREPLAAGVDARRVNRRGDLGVARSTGPLGHGAIARGYPQGIGITTRREVEGVPEAVLRLRQILRNQPGWRVAVVADGHGSMAGARPGDVVIAHDVAVRAGGRVIRQV